MSDATPSGDLPDPLWDRRWLLAGQAVLGLAALGVFAVIVAPTWHWRPFSWGLAIGAGASAAIVGIGRLATRGDGVSTEYNVGTRRRVVIYAAAWLFLGVLAGFGSAMMDSVWPDLLLLASLVLTATLGAVVAASFRRRRV